jgi:hypothetical protein
MGIPSYATSPAAVGGCVHAPHGSRDGCLGRRRKLRMKDVEVHAGELVDVSLTLPFDRKAWDARRGPGAAPSTSAH